MGVIGVSFGEEQNEEEAKGNDDPLGNREEEMGEEHTSCEEDMANEGGDVKTETPMGAIMQK